MKKLIQSPLSSLKKKSRNEAAFTFIELLATVSIMILILAAGAVNYLRYLNKQKLYFFASQLEVMVNDARVKARVGCLGDEDLGFCDQVETVELEMTRDVDSILTVTEKLNCLEGGSIVLSSFEAQDNISSVTFFSILFNPAGAVTMDLDNVEVDQMSITVTNSNSDVLFEFEQGGLLTTSYD